MGKARGTSPVRGEEAGWEEREGEEAVVTVGAVAAPTGASGVRRSLQRVPNEDKGTQAFVSSH